MKKTLAALLAVILLLGMLAACTTETPDETLAETGETEAIETVTLIEKDHKVVIAAFNKYSALCETGVVNYLTHREINTCALTFDKLNEGYRCIICRSITSANKLCGSVRYVDRVCLIALIRNSGICAVHCE